MTNSTIASVRSTRSVAALATALLLFSSSPLLGQACPELPSNGVVSAQSEPYCLTLGQAVGRAMNASPEVRIAQTNLKVIEAEIKAILATAYPKIDGSATYVRTFASPFSGAGGSSADTTKSFDPDTTASLADRIRYLEQNHSPDFGSLFGNLPFGQANAYTLAVTGSQTIYNGGKTAAILRLRTSYRASARLALEESAAGTELTVKQAYVRALLAQSLEEIASASVTQAERFAEQVRLQLSAGRAAELDLLRAEVSLDNLRPQAIQAHSAAELAILDLKRLLDLPLGLSLRLTTPLDIPAESVLTQVPTDPAATLEQRASVQAQRAVIDQQEDQIIVARAAHRPHLDLRMSYGKQIYPDGVFGFGGQDWRTDWTGTLALSVPIFSGGAKSADIERAKLSLELERIHLTQLSAGVELDFQRALGERARAASAIAARQRTVEQAQRVHDLTVLRFESGVSTQLEVSDARLALLQARTNLAQATADLLIADAQVARALGLSPVARSVAK